MGRVIDFSDRSRRAAVDSEHLLAMPDPPIRFPERGREVVFYGVLALAFDAGRAPLRTVVDIAAYIEPLRNRWELELMREAWPASVILQGGYQPKPTREQIIRTRAQIDLLRELFTASFGIPA